MAGDDAPVAGADGARTVHKLALLYGQRLRAHQACGAGPAHQPDHQNNVEQAGLGERHQHNCQRQVRNDEHHIGEAHQCAVSGAARIAGQHANAAADGNRNERRKKADGERHARAKDQVAQHVAPGVIRAQPMLRAWRGVDGVACGKQRAARILRRQQRREHCKPQRKQQHASASQCHAAARQVAPEGCCCGAAIRAHSAACTRGSSQLYSKSASRLATITLTASSRNAPCSTG